MGGNINSRIVLHKATMDDVDFIVDVNSNSDLWRYEDDIEPDKEKVREKVIDRLSGDWHKHFIIKTNDEKETSVGIFYLWRNNNERKSWEIGYCIFAEHQGRGYCFEAANIVLKHAFEDFGAHRVVAMCNSYNKASYGVLEKLGFTKEGVFRQELPWDGKWVNQFFYAMLESEYRQYAGGGE